MKAIKLFTVFIWISFFGNTNALSAQQTEETPFHKKLILLDIAHNQKFWNDPANMKGKDPKQIERIKYMTDEIKKNATSLSAEIGYLKDKIKADDLAKCDLLFIHIPSSKYEPEEIKAITQYLQNGGSLFLAMDEDYWSTLEQTKVNDLIKSFGIQYENQSPDSLNGGYTKAGTITTKSLKITFSGGRIIKGGIPFCYSNQSEKYPFGVYKPLENGGKIIVMGDGMTSLYMTSWKDVNNYQCSEFMNNVFNWLLN